MVYAGCRINLVQAGTQRKRPPSGWSSGTISADLGCWSGRPDLSRGPPAPHAGALQHVVGGILRVGMRQPGKTVRPYGMGLWVLGMARTNFEIQWSQARVSTGLRRRGERVTIISDNQTDWGN